MRSGAGIKRSDRTVNAAGRIGRDLEHVTTVFTASGMGQNQPFLCRQRLHQTVSTHDFHDPFHFVGKHIQTPLRTHPGPLSGQEDLDHPLCTIPSLVHSGENMPMHPP